MSLLLFLLSCAQPPAFDCCPPDGGHRAYPVVAADDVAITDAQREVVRRAMAAGVIPSTLEIEAVTRAAARHARSRSFWEGLHAHGESYAQVASLAEALGHERMMAAWPLVLSDYSATRQSRRCEAGPWQLALLDPRVQVGPCRLRGVPTLWERGRDDPGSVADKDGCLVHACQDDERRDLVASTRAVLAGGPLPEVDPAVAAGIHLLAVCVVPSTEPRPAHCAAIRPAAAGPGP